jgi:hypothetical protein
VASNIVGRCCDFDRIEYLNWREEATPDIHLYFSDFGSLDGQRRADQNIGYLPVCFEYIFEDRIMVVFQILMLLNWTFARKNVVLVVYSEARVDARHGSVFSQF